MTIAHQGLFKLMEACKSVETQARAAPAVPSKILGVKEYREARKKEQELEVGIAHLMAAAAFVIKHRKLNHELIDSQAEQEFEKLEKLNKKVA